MRAQFAILLDGGFFTKKLYEQHSRFATAADVVALCSAIRSRSELSDYELLRIYYYDAPPSDAAIRTPVTGDSRNLATTQRFRESQRLYDQLIMQPEFALRMGETRLSPNRWRLKPRTLSQLVAQPRALTDNDFVLDISQKGVDIRIGMDMARLALRNQVRAVVVVTGDSDFVPAFKFVRREGVEVLLATLGHRGARQELKQHADFVVS